MTSKHRGQLVEAIQNLAREIEDGPWAGLDVVSVLGARDPVSNEVTFCIRVGDPARRLDGSGIEGMTQFAPGEFSLLKAEAGILRELSDVCSGNPAAHDAWQLALQHLEPLRAAIVRARRAQGGEK